VSDAEATIARRDHLHPDVEAEGAGKATAEALKCDEVWTEWRLVGRPESGGPVYDRVAVEPNEVEEMLDTWERIKSGELAWQNASLSSRLAVALRSDWQAPKVDQFERWLPIPGFEGLYVVSDLGRVASLRRRLVMTPGEVAYGYAMGINLTKNGRTVTHNVHKLVMLAFVGPRPKGMQICHNDGDPKNNALSNLRYDTPQGNAEDSKRHGTSFHLNKRHCPNGHLYDEANTYINSKGHRCCRECQRTQARRKYHRRKAEGRPRVRRPAA
jgi:hypothetical protein